MVTRCKFKASKLRKFLIKSHGDTFAEHADAADDGTPESVENTPLEEILLDEIDVLQERVSAVRPKLWHFTVMTPWSVTVLYKKGRVFAKKYHLFLKKGLKNILFWAM